MVQKTHKVKERASPQLQWRPVKVLDQTYGLTIDLLMVKDTRFTPYPNTCIIKYYNQFLTYYKHVSGEKW